MYRLTLECLVFINCILVANGFILNYTSNSIRCKTFKKDGKEIYGLIRLSPPTIELPCYEKDDYFNCQTFYGPEKDYCENICCSKAVKSHTFTIRCEEFTFEGKRGKGFVRETPPLINLPCYEENGVFNCESLFEPDRSFCNSTCCNNSSNIELKDEWGMNKSQARGQNGAETGSSYYSKQSDGLIWRDVAYGLLSVIALLLVVILILVYLSRKYQRRLQQRSRVVCGDSDNNPQLALLESGTKNGLMPDSFATGVGS